MKISIAKFIFFCYTDKAEVDKMRKGFFILFTTILLLFPVIANAEEFNINRIMLFYIMLKKIK